MKISFVVSEDENLGVETIASYLKKSGHQVDLVFDPKQFNKAYTRNKVLAKFFDWQELNLEELERQKPDLIAFSCVTATYPWALEFAKKVKSNLDIPIIFGGTHPTLVPEIVMENDFIDMVCIGEGEDAMLELANSIENKINRTDIKNIWFRRDKQIIKNELRALDQEIDKYDMDRELFFNKLPSNYRRWAYFICSRGCPFNCTYCGNEQKRKIYAGKGRYVRQKSVGQTIGELLELKNGGTKHILFVDDVLTMDRTWFIEFMRRYKKEINLPFTCFVHAKLFDEELAKILKNCRCHLVWYGIQTGSESVRRKILNRHESNEEIINAANICHKYKLKFMVDHIFDIPQDADVKESIRLYNEIKPDMINCYNLLYFPSSKIIEHALEANMLTSADVDKINRGQGIVYQTGGLTAQSKDMRNNYARYALFLTLIPILPKKFVDKVVKSEKWMDFFGKIPIFIIPVLKAFLNFRVNHGFLLWVVIKTEMYWTRKFIIKKINYKFNKNRSLS